MSLTAAWSVSAMYVASEIQFSKLSLSCVFGRDTLLSHSASLRLSPPRKINDSLLNCCGKSDEMLGVGVRGGDIN